MHYTVVWSEIAQQVKLLFGFLHIDNPVYRQLESADIYCADSPKPVQPTSVITFSKYNFCAELWQHINNQIVDIQSSKNTTELFLALEHTKPPP